MKKMFLKAVSVTAALALVSVTAVAAVASHEHRLQKYEASWSEYVDANYHIAVTHTAYECVDEPCEYGYKDPTQRVKEYHFYDYDYERNEWRCDCGDSYTH